MINREIKIASFLEKVATPENVIKRWIVVEEDGKPILARSEDFKKTASEFQSVSDFISNSQPDKSAKSVGSALRKIANLRELPEENVKVIIAEIDPDEKFLNDVMSHLNFNVAKEALFDALIYAVKNSVNPYSYIENILIPSGVSKEAVLSALSHFIKVGKIHSDDFNVEHATLIFNTEADKSSDLYKSGFHAGLRNQKIASTSGQQLRGFYAGREATYSFTDDAAVVEQDEELKQLQGNYKKWDAIFAQKGIKSVITKHGTEGPKHEPITR